MDAASERILMSGWLGEVEPLLRQDFLRAGRVRNFANGSTVHNFEQDQSCIWGVVSGIVRLSVAMNEQLPRIGHIFGPGGWFGEAHVLLGGGRALHATVFGETRLFRIDRSSIAKLAAQNPDAWLEVARLTAMNSLTAIGGGEDLMIRQSDKRLAALLLRLSNRRNAFQGTLPFDSIPVTHTELAEASRLSRSSVAALLQNLVLRKVIRTDYGSISILDAKALETVLAD